MPNNWEITTDRFIAFFDIMGFKEFVERNNHKDVVEKLQKLKASIATIEKLHDDPYITETYKVSESKVITFSDSIIIFSKDNSSESLTKILLDASIFVWSALKNGVPVKGALSYGEITVDFESSLFFGRPIIDAYLLHDQLQLYTAILDHHIESKIKAENLGEALNEFIIKYKANLKGGKITHTLIHPPDKNIADETKALEELLTTVSGLPRIYIDNTKDFLAFVGSHKLNKS